jgi:hypothetical protein
MEYSETLVPISKEEKKKQIITMVVLFFIPIVLSVLGYVLKSIDYFWAIFFWIGSAAVVLVALIPKIVRAVKDDFFSHKIIYQGIIREVRTIKMGVGTASSLLYELVLDKKTLKIGERGLVEIKLLDVPLPTQGEEVEIHTLPKSGDIIKLLVKRNGKWESVELV